MYMYTYMIVLVQFNFISIYIYIHIVYVQFEVSPGKMVTTQKDRKLIAHYFSNRVFNMHCLLMINVCIIMI